MYTSLRTIHHRHGSSTTQSGLLGALWRGKGEVLSKHSYICPHFPFLLLSNQPSYFLFPKVLICGHWLKCLISKLCLGTPVTTLFFTFRGEPKWKLQSATRSICPPILQLNRLANPNPQPKSTKHYPSFHSSHCSSHPFIGTKRRMNVRLPSRDQYLEESHVSGRKTHLFVSSSLHN